MVRAHKHAHKHTHTHTDDSAHCTFSSGARQVGDGDERREADGPWVVSVGLSLRSLRSTVCHSPARKQLKQQSAQREVRLWRSENLGLSRTGAEKESVKTDKYKQTQTNVTALSMTTESAVHAVLLTSGFPSAGRLKETGTVYIGR